MAKVTGASRRANDNGDRSRWVWQGYQANKVRQTANSHKLATRNSLPSSDRLFSLIARLGVKPVPSYKPSTSDLHPRRTAHPSQDARTCYHPSSWRITPLSSLSVYSLTAPLPLPPPNPTSSTSFASRPFRQDRFPNPLQSCMLPRPPRVFPSSPTPSPPPPPSRKRAQSFAHSFPSTSLRTNP